MSLATLAALCVAFIIIPLHTTLVFKGPDPRNYTAFVWTYVYKGPVRGIYLFLVLALGLGGVRRERGIGSAAFTLALPVSRTLLGVTRAAVGLAEVAALALVPVGVIPLLSMTLGAPYPLSTALHFAVLWFIGAAAVFGLAFVFSSVIASEYEAFAAALVVYFIYPLAVGWPALHRYDLNFHRIMSGFDQSYVAPSSRVFVGPLPWVALAIIMAVAALMLSVGIYTSTRQDF